MNMEKKVIVRGDRSGVFFGTLAERNGREVKLKNCRRIWYWAGAAKDLFIWHHVLTGSCRTGREAFCKDRGIDVENDNFSVIEFVDLTKDAYGGGTVRKLLRNE